MKKLLTFLLAAATLGQANAQEGRPKKRMVRTASEVTPMINFGWHMGDNVKSSNLADTAITQRAVVLNKRDTFLLQNCKPEEADGQLSFGVTASEMLDIQVWNKDKFYHLSENPAPLQSNITVIPVKVEKYDRRKHPVINVWMYD